MSAGSGVSHSERNASATEPVRFLQIWILPQRAGGPPSYEQKHVPAEEGRAALRLVASRDGRGEGSVRIQQDVDVFARLLEEGEAVVHALRPGHTPGCRSPAGAAS